MAELFWMVAPYVMSWFVNFLIIAIVVAIFDEQKNFGIEYHQYLGGFLLFVLPTLGEFLSWWFNNKPMIHLG
jgi:hypothetical protein